MVSRFVNGVSLPSGFRRFAYPLLVTAGLIAFGYYVMRFEDGYPQMPYEALASTSLLACLFLIITRRLKFSILLTLVLAAVVVIVSKLKYAMLTAPLLAYDFIFYLGSRGTIDFLLTNYTQYVAGLLLALTALVLVLRKAYRADTFYVGRAASLALLVVCIGGGYLASGGYFKTLYAANDRYHLTVFYRSIDDAISIVSSGPLFEMTTTAEAAVPPFGPQAECTTDERAPHVIVIHQESGFPPAFYKSIKYNQDLDPFFRSFDGKLHKLRVETYGGGSWLTEFSLLSGVSTYSFGKARTFIQALMRGRLKNTVPQYFQHCGYRTAAFYTMLSSFVASGPFYKSIGFQDFFDSKDQGAKSYKERDSFYYGNFVHYLEKSLAQSNQRVFAYVLTNATHHPYTSAIEPQLDVHQNNPENSPEMNEYLRRMLMAKMDYEAFLKTLAERFPGEKFVIVRYGDHQPNVANGVPEISQINVRARTDPSFDVAQSDKFATYYTVDAIGMLPPPLPDFEILEVPYLSTIITNSAGLPPSEDYIARLVLMHHCRGLYYSCADKRTVLDFHRRLVGSGMVDIN